MILERVFQMERQMLIWDQPTMRKQSANPSQILQEPVVVVIDGVNSNAPHERDVGRDGEVKEIGEHLAFARALRLRAPYSWERAH